MRSSLLIYGHRGSAGTHPENTLISFKTAEKAGADGIELNVQLSFMMKMLIEQQMVWVG